MRALLIALVLLASCGPGIAGGPTMSGKMNQDEDPPPPEIQSNDILARDAVTKVAEVQHILIGWKGLARRGPADPRAEARSRADADKLAVELLGRVRAGEDMTALMKEYSEDPGSAEDGRSYTVTTDAQLVFEFKRLGMRLNVGEAGLVLTDFGWHVMKRIE